MTTSWLVATVTGPTNVLVTCEVATPGAVVRAAVSTSPSLSTPTSSATATADAEGFATLSVAGLAAGTRYWVGIESDGVLDTVEPGTFVTPSAVAGQARSFVGMVVSCGRNPANSSPSTHAVHTAAAARRVDFLDHIGDFHYLSSASTDPAVHRAAYRAQLVAANARALWRSASFHHIYDDHDGGPNDWDRTNPGKDAACAAARKFFPQVGSVLGSGPLYKARTEGRFRLITTDERYFRSPYTDPDDASKTFLGETQLQWFLGELLAAKEAGLYPVWLSSQVPHHGNGTAADLSAYATERRRIWDFLAANGINNLIVFAGDVHAMGYKVGVDYSTAKTAPARIYVSSALESTAGLPSLAQWDAIVPGNGQYLTWTVVDHTTWVQVTVDFWHVDPSGVERRYFRDAFTLGVVPPTAGIYPIRRNSDGVRGGAYDAGGAQRYAVLT